MDTIIAALIGIAGVMITAFVSLVAAYKQSYGNNVSKERSIWLQHFREEISDIRAGIYALNSFYRDEEAKAKRLEILAKAEGSRCSLISRLKSEPKKGNEYNDELKKILKEINFNNADYEKVNKELDLFEKYSNLILEREWDKVKNEQTDRSYWKIIAVFPIFIFIIISSLFSAFLFDECKTRSCSFTNRNSLKVLLIITISLISILIIILIVNFILQFCDSRRRKKDE